jgi:queuine tRNA-ribosyltransferase
MLFTRNGIINIKNRKWQDDFSPIDEESPCRSSRFYSKGYLRHLIHNQEILGAQIATLHNLSFYLWLVGEARRQIQEGRFMTWKNQIIPALSQRI